MIVRNWRGKKNRSQVSQVLDYLPEGPLLEVFGGSGAVTAAAESSRERWWNDADPTLYRLALEVRDHVDRLARDIRKLPRPGDGDIAYNRRWDGIRGVPYCDWEPSWLAWASCVTAGGRIEGRAHDRPIDGVGMLPEWYVTNHSGWRGVWLTCRDALDVISDSAGWSIYADPPYPGSNCSGYAAKCDHGALIGSLERHGSPVLLASYASPSGWWCMLSRAKRKRVMSQSLRGEIVSSPEPLVPLQTAMPLAYATY